MKFGMVGVSLMYYFMGFSEDIPKRIIYEVFLPPFCAEGYFSYSHHPLQDSNTLGLRIKPR
jgi:hypothetical protein